MSALVSLPAELVDRAAEAVGIDSPVRGAAVVLLHRNEVGSLVELLDDIDAGDLADELRELLEGGGRR